MSRSASRLLRREIGVVVIVFYYFSAKLGKIYEKLRRRSRKRERKRRACVNGLLGKEWAFGSEWKLWDGVDALGGQF